MIEIGLCTTDGKYAYLFYDYEYPPAKAGWTVEPRYKLIAFFDNGDDRHKMIHHTHKNKISPMYVSQFRTTKKEYAERLEGAVKRGIYNIVPSKYLD